MKIKIKILLICSALIIASLSSIFIYNYISQKPINKQVKIVVVFKDYENLSEFWHPP